MLLTSIPITRPVGPVMPSKNGSINTVPATDLKHGCTGPDGKFLVTLAFAFLEKRQRVDQIKIRYKGAGISRTVNTGKPGSK